MLTLVIWPFGELAIGLIYFCLRYAQRKGAVQRKAGLIAFWLYTPAQCCGLP